jgi:hypothetical protein
VYGFSLMSHAGLIAWQEMACNWKFTNQNTGCNSQEGRRNRQGSWVRGEVTSTRRAKCQLWRAGQNAMAF